MTEQAAPGAPGTERVRAPMTSEVLRLRLDELGRCVTDAVVRVAPRNR